jgi:hypothetical protein
MPAERIAEPAEIKAMSDYDDDILLWSERQAELLRRMAAGERVNDQVDWENVAEEIESVGRTERRACESHLVQARLHDLKAEAWPLARDVSHWRAKARQQRGEARAAFSPSMRQRIDVAATRRLQTLQTAGEQVSCTAVRALFAQAQHWAPESYGESARICGPLLFARNLSSITAAEPRCQSHSGAGGRRNPRSRAVLGRGVGSAARHIAHSVRSRFSSPAFAFATMP